MTLQMSPEVQRAIDRLRKIDPAKPALDRPTVAAALRAQFAALNLSDRPIIWVADAQTGYARVSTAAGVAAWTTARANPAREALPALSEGIMDNGPF